MQHMLSCDALPCLQPQFGHMISPAPYHNSQPNMLVTLHPPRSLLGSLLKGPGLSGLREKSGDNAAGANAISSGNVAGRPSEPAKSQEGDSDPRGSGSRGAGGNGAVITGRAGNGECEKRGSDMLVVLVGADVFVCAWGRSRVAL